MVSPELTERTYRPSRGEFSLAPAAEVLAAAFAPLGQRPAMARCTHCITDADVRALQEPVTSLPPALVSRFVRKVGTTWGDVEDLRRACPRVLVLAADHRLDISRSVVWQKMRWAGWTGWPDHEREAIDQFLIAEFTRLLRVPPRPSHVAHRWLAQVSAGVDDLSGVLTVWQDSMGSLPHPSIQTSAASHLVELLTSSPLRPDLPATMDEVFPANHGAAAQVTEFLTGPGTDHDLRRIADHLAGTRRARRVSVAIERLRRFRAAADRGPGPVPDLTLV